MNHVLQLPQTKLNALKSYSIKVENLENKKLYIRNHLEFELWKK